MNLDEFLSSEYGGIRGLVLPHFARRVPYPGSGGTREELLAELLEMDAKTRDSLDKLGLECLAGPPLRPLSAEESYMDAQRTLCFLDFLSRLADSTPPGVELRPTPEGIAAWRNGVWRQFGGYWMRNAAGRMAQGMDVFGL